MDNVSYIDNKNELAYHRVSNAPSYSEKFKLICVSHTDLVQDF